MNLQGYFDQVFLVNLQRRPDRLLSVQETLRQCDWPFKWPTVLQAVDGHMVPHPNGWQSGPGAWGCMRSHQQIFEQTMMAGSNSVLILEDDVCFVPDFRRKVTEFLQAIPEDWDQIMMGGEHVNTNGVPTLIKPGVYRCTDCERTHCYAIRGEFMKKLYRRWISGGDFNGEVHCDWIMGRDPEMQAKHKVYAPDRFLAGQERGRSDIDGSIQARKFWNPPASDLPVLHLVVPSPVMAALRHYGVHTGQHEDHLTGIDSKLFALFADTKNDLDARAEKLSKRISELQWEVASDPYLVCTIWHPEANLELIKEATSGPVYEVVADSVEMALDKFPAELRRLPRPLLAKACVIHLDAPRRVMDGLRQAGWHNGFNLDGRTGLNKNLVRLFEDRRGSNALMHTLTEFITNLQREAAGIHGGVAVIWHPHSNAQLVRTASNAYVIEISATEIREALDKFSDAKNDFFNTKFPVQT